jgi:hypothetical protein
MHHFLHASLPLRRFKGNHKVGGRYEADLPGSVRGEQCEGDRQVGFAHATRAKQDHVFTALDEAQPGEFLDLLAGALLAKAKL